jgi:putative ABC transport system permease protein
METLLQDFRYAFRLLRKSPGFAVAAVLTLALGMSANTVMFSVLNTVLLRPLPYPQADRLVQIWETDARRGDMHNTVSPYNFLDWRNQSQSFEQMATYEYSSVVLTGQKAPARLSALFVTASFFDVLKVSPLKGRTFLPDEDQSGKPRVAVLGYGAWQRHFGGDPEIVGKSVLLDDQAYSIVGVMPADFGLPRDRTDVWCVPGFDLKGTSRPSHYLQSMGRLKPGVSLQQAQMEMNTIAERLAATYKQPFGVRLVSLQNEIVGNARRSLLVLWVAVLAVLLIACANVAGLLLARAVGRQKEVAIRSALGGSRARLMQQFLAESVLLATLGGILDVALSYSAGRFVVAASQGAVPRLRDLQMDGRVLAFTAIACVLTGLAFGLAPALSALRIDLNSSLKESGAAAQVSDRLHLRSLFVVAEVALAMVLLVGGSLLAKTLWRLQHVDTGFRAENILTFRFTVPPKKFATSAQRSELYERIAERLAALPGVESVGATNDLPFGGSRSGSSFDIEGRTPDPQLLLHAGYRTVSPGYFSTMRIRLLQGREFSLHDNQGGVFVAAVNQAFVKKFFANESPLGHRLKSHDHLYEIVGVVGDVKHEDLGAPSFPELYLCNLQAEIPPWTFFAVRSRTEPKALIPTVREGMKQIAPEEPIQGVNTMTDLVEYWMSPQKFNSLLLAIFAGLALVLAAIGIYGVIAYSVVQRTREIGIRMALGADRANVLCLILRQGARIGMLGLVIGSIAAYLSTRALSSMLYGVNPHDPLIFATIAVSLFVVVVLASYIPARRATCVDPLIALRYE